MNFILDTCALIWWSLDPDQLSPKAKIACDQMEQLKNGIVPSTAIWEVAIKVKNGKLDLGVDLVDYVATLQKSDVIQILPIDETLWLKSVQLPWQHRDPADRVVVAIAEQNQTAIITADKKIADFYSPVIW